MGLANRQSRLYHACGPWITSLGKVGYEPRAEATTRTIGFLMANQFGASGRARPRQYCGPSDVSSAI
jgi:hypothetical protein